MQSVSGAIFDAACMKTPPVPARPANCVTVAYSVQKSHPTAKKHKTHADAPSDLTPVYQAGKFMGITTEIRGVKREYTLFWNRNDTPTVGE